MILHLLPYAVWQEFRAAQVYVPASYADDGFVHCSGDDDVMLAVANQYYRDATEDLVVLEVAESALAAEVRWEAPHPTAPPDPPPNPPPGVPAGTRVPHVYGPLERRAVVGVRRLVRGADGGFVGYGLIE